MKPFPLALVVLLAILAAHGHTAGEEIYTWTDAQGDLHITDRPPPEPSQVQDVLRYTPPPPSLEQLHPAPSPGDGRRVEALHKQIDRLKERKILLDRTIADNQVSIAAAEKELAYYRKRSGSYARRNEQAIQRQLMVLNNNLATHQNELKYVLEDIADAQGQLGERATSTCSSRSAPTARASCARSCASRTWRRRRSRCCPPG